MAKDTARPTDTEDEGENPKIYNPVRLVRELYRLVVKELDLTFPGGAEEAGYRMAITCLVIELVVTSVWWLVWGPRWAVVAGLVSPVLMVLVMAAATVVVYQKQKTR